MFWSSFTIESKQDREFLRELFQLHLTCSALTVALVCWDGGDVIRSRVFASVVFHQSQLHGLHRINNYHNSQLSKLRPVDTVHLCRQIACRFLAQFSIQWHHSATEAGDNFTCYLMCLFKQSFSIHAVLK